MSGDTVDSIEIQYSMNLVSDKAGSCINPVSISSRLGAWPRPICELTTVVTTNTIQSRLTPYRSRCSRAVTRGQQRSTAAPRV
jgi:hypothetical protein